MFTNANYTSKECGKQIPKKSAVLLLTFPSKGFHWSVDFLVSQKYRIVITLLLRKQTQNKADIYIYFFLKSTKLFGLVPLNHSETNRYNSDKPHLNIIAFSGKREHQLIETWSSAQFQEVSVTQLGYSWHPSAAAAILTQDSNSSQPRRKDNSFRRPYHTKNRMSISTGKAVAA